jgi:hypothetical protein
MAVLGGNLRRARAVRPLPWRGEGEDPRGNLRFAVEFLISDTAEVDELGQRVLRRDLGGLRALSPERTRDGLRAADSHCDDRNAGEAVHDESNVIQARLDPRLAGAGLSGWGARSSRSPPAGHWRHHGSAHVPRAGTLSASRSRPIEVSAELRLRALLRLTVDEEVALLVVEAREPGDLLALGER